MDTDHAGGPVLTEIIRRLGVPPKMRGSQTSESCPDVFELSDGRFVFIGTDVTEELSDHLPADAGCADYERIVVVSRETLIRARNDIPDK